MTFSQALGLVAALAAYFPRVKLDEDTREAWAHALVEYDVIDGLAGANALGRSSRFLPSLAELIDEVRRARAERMGHRPALPEPELPPYPFARFLAEHPDMRQRVIAQQGSLGGQVLGKILADEIAGARRGHG